MEEKALETLKQYLTISSLCEGGGGGGAKMEEERGEQYSLAWLGSQKWGDAYEIAHSYFPNTCQTVEHRMSKVEDNTFINKLKW